MAKDWNRESGERLPSDCRLRKEINYIKEQSYVEADEIITEKEFQEIHDNKLRSKGRKNFELVYK